MGWWRFIRWRLRPENTKENALPEVLLKCDIIKVVMPLLCHRTHPMSISWTCEIKLLKQCFKSSNFMERCVVCDKKEKRWQFVWCACHCWTAGGSPRHNVQSVVSAKAFHHDEQIRNSVWSYSDFQSWNRMTKQSVIFACHGEMYNNWPHSYKVY